ncbi:PspC domain-containing protein [Bacillus cereus group sp. MYBK134-1]|uniref:PspC domain-containing protein n=1 Tax=unclassified Bacillus cereus group TaxID=2750818 RepID=UPI003F7ABC2A
MKKLYKSTQDKQVSGVLGGLSDKYGIDVSILRIVTAVSDFFRAKFFGKANGCCEKSTTLKNTVQFDKIKL